LKTDNDGVYAIGVIALDNNFIYGLIAPGYKIAGLCAKVVARRNLPAFMGANLLSKVKLLGCNAALFGENQPCPDDPDVLNSLWNNPLGGMYH
jgi:nitrite reductase (NADH) large subunit